jgi:hypothetical protein
LAHRFWWPIAGLPQTRRQARYKYSPSSRPARLPERPIPANINTSRNLYFLRSERRRTALRFDSICIRPTGWPRLFARLANCRLHLKGQRWASPGAARRLRARCCRVLNCWLSVKLFERKHSKRKCGRPRRVFRQKSSCERIIQATTTAEAFAPRSGRPPGDLSTGAFRSGAPRLAQPELTSAIGGGRVE